MAISFFDKLRLNNEEKMEKCSVIVLNKYDVDGLDEIVNEIGKLREEGNYRRLVMTNLKYNLFVDNETASYELKCEIVDKGREFLGYQPVNLPPFTRVISYQDLQSLYNFLMGIYVTCLDRQLSSKEIKKICNNIEVRVMKNLDQFDQITGKPTITEDYFKKLRKIKWKNKKTRGLWLDVGELRIYSGFPRRKTPVRFIIEHDLLTQFLAACSAVNNNRDKIEQKDVIIAYKTYLKLLKTDIPALIDKLDKEHVIKTEISE